MSHNRQKKIAVVNDLCGFGHCSLAVALPLISCLGVQCCPLPTAILSNHTGFPTCWYDDRTDGMAPFMDQWRALGLEFEGILTGYLGSERQVELVERFLEEFTTGRTTVIVDPVMGDGGVPYANRTPELCRGMVRLVRRAHVVTPNLTEACLLTGRSYRERFAPKELAEMAEELSDMGPDRVAITGVARGSWLENYCFQRGEGLSVVRSRRVEPSRPGTGDVFSSVLAAELVRGTPFRAGVGTAARFVRRCLIRSAELDIPVTDGVCFEEVMGELVRKKGGPL